MQQYLTFKNKSASLRLHHWGDGRATLSNLHSKRKGKGHAKSLMKNVIKVFDATKLTVILEAKAYGKGGMTTAQLMKFYEKFGFKLVWNDPKLMERKPRKK